MLLSIVSVFHDFAEGKAIIGWQAGTGLFKLLLGKNACFHALGKADFLLASKQRHASGFLEVQPYHVVGIHCGLVARVVRQVEFQRVEFFKLLVLWEFGLRVFDFLYLWSSLRRSRRADANSARPCA